MYWFRDAVDVWFQLLDRDWAADDPAAADPSYATFVNIFYFTLTHIDGLCIGILARLAYNNASWRGLLVYALLLVVWVWLLVLFSSSAAVSAQPAPTPLQLLSAFHVNAVEFTTVSLCCAAVT